VSFSKKDTGVNLRLKVYTMMIQGFSRILQIQGFSRIQGFFRIQGFSRIQGFLGYWGFQG